MKPTKTTKAELREQLADAALEWVRCRSRFLNTSAASSEAVATSAVLLIAVTNVLKLAAQIEALQQGEHLSCGHPLSDRVLVVYERPGSPPGNHLGCKTCIAEALPHPPTEAEAQDIGREE